MLAAQVRGRFDKPSEYLKSRINVYRIDMRKVLNECEIDRNQYPLKANIPGSEAIKNEFNLAVNNGHVIKKGESYLELILKEEGTFSFSVPLLQQTTLVLGCGHQSNICPNHKSNHNPTHYTVDIEANVGPNAICHMYDKRLWENLRDYPFEQVILEGAGKVSDSLLMKSIFNILKPGGIVKTLHFHSSMWIRDNECTVEAFLYNSTISFLGKPLTTLTIKKHLENIGFTNIEIYTPTPDEDAWEIRTAQLRATKPSNVGI